MVAHKGSTALTPVLEGRDRTNSTLAGQKRVSVKLTADKSPVQSTKHPWKDRKALSEDYESQISGREGWWRTYIRETPLPGSYETEDFLVDLNKRPHTYRFKSVGRKIDAHPHGKGALLLPGAYEIQPFTRRLEQQPATYNFKAIDRGQRDFSNLGRKDKDINVSPNAYDMDKYLTVAVDKQPSKHSMFKSQSRRFPTMPFKPRTGPGPGNYEYSPEVPLHPVSSSFKSKTPRFSSSHTISPGSAAYRVPGPGTYAKTHQYPMNKNISNMGRQHGLFFTSAFQA